MSTCSEGLPPPKPTWLPMENMPDCSGKVYIVTGGNSGIGYETVKALLKKGGKVYMASRNRQLAEEAIAELEKDTGRRAIFLELDLANLRSVRRAAEEFVSKEERLHVLFNNGGVMVPPKDKFTADGYDLQWGTNVVGHFLFTKLLLPTLLATSSALPAIDKPRIINVSSIGHKLFHSHIDYATLRDSPARAKLGPWALYGQSKFGNLVVNKELARRYDGRIVSIGLHPGGIKSNLYKGATVMKTISNWLSYEAWQGAITSLYAGTAPEAATMNGEYLIPWARLGKAHPGVDDPETGRKLWEYLENEVKDYV